MVRPAFYNYIYYTAACFSQCAIPPDVCEDVVPVMVMFSAYRDNQPHGVDARQAETDRF